MSIEQKLTEARENAPAETRAIIIGLVVNAVLTVCKFIVGIATHSAALYADGLKDLSEAVKSVLTIVTKRISADVRTHRERPAAAKHLEEVLGLVAAAVVIYLGIHSVISSFRDVMDEHATNYTPALIIISAASVALKAYMSRSELRLGRQLNSDALIERGYTAMSDSVIAGVILGGALIDHTLHVDIDPWVGFVIGGLILYHAVRSVLRRRNGASVAGE